MRSAWVLTMIAALAVAALGDGTSAGPHARAQPAATQRLGVPAYIYPTDPRGDWARLLDAAPIVGAIVINPHNGPGGAANPDYLAVVEQARARGVRVLGYVHTAYSARPAVDVRAEIDRYYTFYPLDGIFIDQSTPECAEEAGGAARFAYYRVLAEHVKAQGFGPRLVVLNPGRQTGACYMDIADVLVTFESYEALYREGYIAPAWTRDYPPERFWHLVHSVPATVTDVQQVVALARWRGAGTVYVTPRAMPNPWSELPPAALWAALLDAVQAATPTRDTAPPTSAATLMPAAAATGPVAGDVTVTLTATDANGGAGVQALVYRATGAQMLPETLVRGAVASITVRARGTTTISYFARDHAGNTEAERTLTVRVAAPPAVPVNLRAGSVTETSIQAVWDAPANPDAVFQLGYSAAAVPEWRFLTLPAETRAYVVEGLRPANVYYFYVRGCVSDTCSAWSNPLTGITAGPPPSAPANLRRSAATDTSIDVAWDDTSASEMLFVLLWSPAVAPNWSWAVLPPDTVASTIGGLITNATYYAYVVACNAAGCSPLSNPLTAAAVSGLPPAPTRLRLAGPATTGSLPVAWEEAATNETHFQLGWSRADISDWTFVVLPPNSVAYTISGLAAGVTYYAYVHACNAAGCSEWSNPLTATTATVTVPSARGRATLGAERVPTPRPAPPPSVSGTSPRPPVFAPPPVPNPVRPGAQPPPPPAAPLPGRPRTAYPSP